MCSWSNWQFICNGRFDILLALLIALTAVVALVLILVVYLRNQQQPGEFLHRAMERIKANRHAIFGRKGS